MTAYLSFQSRGGVPRRLDAESMSMVRKVLPS